MANSGNGTGLSPRMAGGKQDRIVKDSLVDIFREAGVTREQVRRAIQRAIDRGEGPDLRGETGNVDEICETCCDEHLQIIFQRETQVVAKGRTSETWYATVGTMVVRKLSKTERTVWLSPSNETRPTFSSQTLMTTDYVERGGPGSDVSGSGKMIKAGTYDLARWDGDAHSTYNYSKTVGPHKHRALNIRAKPGSKLLGNRTGINIHVSTNWDWSIGCFLPVPTDMIAYDTLSGKKKEERNKASNFSSRNLDEGYAGKKRPYWNGPSTLRLMSKLIEIVEEFTGNKPLPKSADLSKNRAGPPLKCVEVIIREPTGEYKIKGLRKQTYL